MSLTSVRLIALLLFIVIVEYHIQVQAFHLPFGHRLFKSAQNPQLNPASSLIRPIECRNSNNHSEVGICMFSIDCMQNKGVPLSVCKHNYFVGTCCRLPDYNNFVGIVYDLRETEANQALEARKGSSVAATTAPIGLPASLPATTAMATMAPQAMASSQQPSSPSSPITSQSTTQTSSSIQQTATSPAASSSEPSNQQTASKPEERYIISATSLFPTGQPTPATSNSASIVGESARNVDGQAASSINLQNSLVSRNQIELDSFHIQTAASVASTSNLSGQQQQQNSTYEISKAPQDSMDSALPTTASNQLQQLGLSSTTAAIALEEERRPLSQIGEVTEVKLPQQVQQVNSIYLMEEQQQPNQQNIIFANNHSQQPNTITTSTNSVTTTTASFRPPMTTTAATTKGPPPPPTSMAVTSDQEFTLSSSSSSSLSSSPDSLADQPNSSSTSTISTSLASEFQGNVQGDTYTTLAFSPPANQPLVNQPPQNQVEQSSGPVDLISSPAGTETTTPFTSSLSTALLPNISSHPYAPTEAPPLTLASSSSSTSPLVVQASQPPQLALHQRTPSPLPSLQLGQLYSNQHSQVASSRPAPVATWQPSAAKIVTGGSSAQNLIPGLGGLQSSLLSHIPFKLASGLSSGLSNYLQAHMKPAQGGSFQTRPLMSSNNQPAAQFLQQSSGGKPSATGAIRFPSSSSSPLPSSTAATSPEASSTPSSTPTSALMTNQVSASNGSSSLLLSVATTGDTVRDAQLVCGRPQVMPMESASKSKRVARIVGGNQSLFGQWPWMVSLRQWRKGAFLHKCGAALLNEKWAITAAHCVENVKASDLLLRLGEFDVSNQEEPFPYMERRVKQVVSHPLFDPKTFEYDLALLKFSEPIKYERNVVPVCVPSGNDTYVDRMATVIGWGRLYEDGPLPDVIQHVDVPIITNNECEKMYKNAGYIEEIPDMFICAGISKGGRDSCEGDSGGPLTMVDHDGRSYLVGIISWGIGCALPSQPGVYTRITAFSGWINQITAQ